MSDDTTTADANFFEVYKYPPFGPQIRAMAMDDGGIRIEITIDDFVGIELTRTQADALATWIRCALVA